MTEDTTYSDLGLGFTAELNCHSVKRVTVNLEKAGMNLARKEIILTGDTEDTLDDQGDPISESDRDKTPSDQVEHNFQADAKDTLGDQRELHSEGKNANTLGDQGEHKSWKTPRMTWALRNV